MGPGEEEEPDRLERGRGLREGEVEGEEGGGKGGGEERGRGGGGGEGERRSTGDPDKVTIAFK